MNITRLLLFLAFDTFSHWNMFLIGLKALEAERVLEEKRQRLREMVAQTDQLEQDQEAAEVSKMLSIGR
jgi:hypothetical protein